MHSCKGGPDEFHHSLHTSTHADSTLVRREAEHKIKYQLLPSAQVSVTSDSFKKPVLGLELRTKWSLAIRMWGGGGDRSRSLLDFLLPDPSVALAGLKFVAIFLACGSEVLGMCHHTKLNVLQTLLPLSNQ